jgi:hypothetical protein
MDGLNSYEAMRMFAILGEHIGAKPEKRSVPERVNDLVEALHASGFVIVPHKKERDPEVPLNVGEYVHARMA